MRFSWSKMRPRTLPILMRAKFGKRFRSFWGRITRNKKAQCRKFFDGRCKSGRSFWDDLGRAHPSCECERVSVSDYSPGPVNDDETLISVVTSKRYVSLDGRVEPTFFDERVSEGMSADRREYTSQHCHDLRAQKLVEGNSQKEYCGSIELEVGFVREIYHEGMRAIAVYDTALYENRSHAEIACTEVPPKGTDNRKKHRANLRRKILNAVLHDGSVLSSSDLFENQSSNLPSPHSTVKCNTRCG